MVPKNKAKVRLARNVKQALAGGNLCFNSFSSIHRV